MPRVATTQTAATARTSINTKAISSNQPVRRFGGFGSTLALTSVVLTAGFATAAVEVVLVTAATAGDRLGRVGVIGIGCGASTGDGPGDGPGGGPAVVRTEGMLTLSVKSNGARRSRRGWSDDASPAGGDWPRSTPFSGTSLMLIFRQRAPAT